MFWVCVLALAAAVAIWRLFWREPNPIDNVVGPPGYPVIGNTLEILWSMPHGFLDKFKELGEKYGDRYKLQMFNFKIMVIFGPKDIEVVLTHSKNIKKSTPYAFLKDWLGSGLLLSTGQHWQKRRKILTPTFHFNILKIFAGIFEEKSRNLVNQLKEKKGDEVDLMPTISDFTLFAICETAMGTKLDESSTTVKYKEAILSIGSILLNRLVKVWLHSDFIFKMTSEGRRFAKSLTTAKIFAENVIKVRMANRVADTTREADVDDTGTKKRLAMLDLLLEANDKGEIDMEGIKDEVNTFMFEGHDTTAVGLTYALMLIADHKEVQDRLYEECQQIFGDSDRAPSMTDLASMKYLEAVIKESLRLYPSVPVIGREIVEDFMLGDLLVKKGTIIDIHIHLLHRREDLFPDAEAFKPERFLTGEHENPYIYVPFSAGPRNCIGQRFAMQEMKCLLSEVVRSFELVPKVPGFRPKTTLDMVLRPLEPIYVKFVQREKSK